MLNEKKLSKAELDKREDIIMKMKKNKSALVKKYGKDAEKVMYGRATNIAKKQAESMENTKIKEMIKSALMGPMVDPEVGEDRYREEQDLATVSHALDQLEAKLKAHDWYYMMSDDHRVYTNGRHEQSEIRSIMDDLEGLGYGKDAKDLYNQYAPHKEGGPSFRMKEAKGKDMDKDGDIDSDDYMAARDAAIKKAKGEVKEDGVGDVIDPAEYGDIGAAYLKGFNKPHSLNLDQLETLGRKIVKQLYKGDFKAAKAKFLSETVLNEDKVEALMELRNILDELQVLGDQARNIIKENFPSFLSKGEAYGAFDMGSSSNRYDTTLASIVADIEEYGDEEDEDMMQEDMDLGHQDNEPHMLKGDLYRIGKYAMELYQMVDGFEGKGEVDFPHWWQSKIIKAKDYLVGAKHYLDFEVKEPQIDAMVDVAQDVEAIDEAKYTDYSNNELAAYVKNNPNDKTAAAELKKRSQKLKDLSRTDIKEAVGKFVVRPCSAKDTPWAVWQTSKDGENDKRIKGFKTKEDAKKFADEKNSLAESLNEDKFSLLKGASKQTIARDTEESDREYIATRQKRDKISQKMYGKDYRELDSRQKDKVNQLRRQSSQFESVNEESTTFKKGDKVTYLGYPAEITFVGKDQMGRIYYSVSYDKGQGRTKASNLYNKGGEIKPLDEVTKSQMLKKAKKGSYPATLVAIENGKVVAQEKVNTPQEAPAAHSVMSKKYPNANIRLEDSTGKILKEMMSLDDKAKAYYLAKIKNGEIDTLPEDPKAAFLAQMTKDQMDHDKETLRRERGLEEGTLTPSLSITNPIKEFATKLAKQLKENND